MHGRLQEIETQLESLHHEARSIDHKIVQNPFRVYSTLWTAASTVLDLRRPRLGTTALTWRTGILLVIPLFCATGTLILLTETVSSGSFHLREAAVSFIVCQVILGLLLYVPSDNWLTRVERYCAKKIDDSIDFNKQVRRELAELTSIIRPLECERDAIVASIEFRRSQVREGATKLLSTQWKEMKGTDFEDFLVMLFENLGADVKTTPTSGDQGVDLVVTLNGKQIAVQAKGGVTVVGNKAVMEVHAGKLYYKCETSAVITNNRFTRQAKALATSADCLLISASDIPALALGFHPDFPPGGQS